MSSKKIFLLLSFSILVISVFVLSIPVSYEKSKVVPIDFETEFKDEATIEQGETNVAQEGKAGERYIRYKYKQSLFDYMFMREKAKKTEIENKTTIDPVDKIVLNGIRKWQYMMCSDGSYRYYTDEQFKERNTGFTSKSPDYCAQFKQGNKISLADTPKGTSNYTKPSYVPPNCTMVEIPYKTIYKDASWLYVGETQDGYGYNGFKYICSDGSTRTSYPATDKIVYRGTKVKPQPSSYKEPSIPTSDYAAKGKCDSDYSYAKAKLSISGAADSSAMELVKQLYAQCLARAGY